MHASKELLGITNTEKLRKCVLDIHRKNGSLEDGMKSINAAVDYMPLSIISQVNEILREVVEHGREKEWDVVRKEFDCAISECALMFTKMTEDKNDPERTKYEKRMKRLRLKVEEKKYMKLTENLTSVRIDHDKTTKSMTYATSIGANMIVAPISFGIFVYFFAGQFIDFEDKHTRIGKRKDAKRVIFSILAGVFMLFAEMILYVIRSHQLDVHTTKKKKKTSLNPFGHYNAKTVKNHNEEKSLKVS